MTNDQGYYAALIAKDARFDGRFFVGIASTGIYCRPVCRARKPKPEHCSYYQTAAEAEQAGYRPCLLCRPELAPGYAITDATAKLAYRAARMLEESCGSGQSLETLAGRLGCTTRHLRRVFTAAYHVTPVQYLQTCRLLLAKNLLTETDLSVLEVAMAAGFGSLRRFNDLFKNHYHLSPTALRKKAAGEGIQKSEITLALGYRPPYRWKEMLKFLADRTIAGVDLVKDQAYLRTVRIKSGDGTEAAGWIRVENNSLKNVLTVTASDTLMPVLPQVLSRIKRLFDLYCDPAAVYEHLSVMNELQPGLCLPGTRLPGCFDSFEMAVRAVLGQQITVKAAGTLAGRLTAACGTPVRTGIPGLTHAFPAPEEILALTGPVENHLGPLGIIASRAGTIYELAGLLTAGAIVLDFCPDPEVEMEKLKAIRGIGDWTAQYIAMRTMEWPDAFLSTDVGVKKALKSYPPEEIARLSKQWRPWRSYATVNLWNSLH